MHLSVIIPSYNRAAVIGRAVESVLAQCLPFDGFTMELIIVDDGSNDNTAQVLAEYPNLIVLNQINQGVSAARNAGVGRATGEWIAFLDSDDEWLPQKLQLQFSALQESGLKVCHSEEIWIRNGVRVNQMRKHRKYGGDIFLRCLPLCAMSPSSIVIHRSVFEQVGNFDTQLPACEDYDLWLRVCARYPVAFVEQPCINKFGGHADQLSRRYWGMDRFRVIALEKILAHSLSPEQHAATLETLLGKLRILSQGAVKHNNDELRHECEQKLAAWQQHQIAANA